LLTHTMQVAWQILAFSVIAVRQRKHRSPATFTCLRPTTPMSINTLTPPLLCQVTSFVGPRGSNRKVLTLHDEKLIEQLLRCSNQGARNGQGQEKSKLSATFLSKRLMNKDHFG
jgi:hypothetical protein